MTENRYSDIAENIERIRARIEEAALAAGRRPEEITLMAVTKTVPAEVVNMAVAQGVTLLGENRAQELLSKYEAYADGASIHFIGHLQSNKVKQIIDKVDMIHSVGGARLAAEISRQAGAIGKTRDVLIEVNVGGEESKSGVTPEETAELAREIEGLDHIRLRGLMTIPPVCDTIYESEAYFERVYKVFVDIREKNRDNSSIDILSMGMSQDFPAAIKHGSTIIRIGTALFGSRA
ncbi:YggS family pyridoxal phosphate enzyme [Clostridia bacterium]|nr:YggS family pyridoxal phosphate enzyme [Clostridia bacterium]